jgi:hypothetical protein
MADQADFVNLGTVETSNGTMVFDGNNLVEGTAIPVENGGDPFALQFHSWDLDQGGLSFTGAPLSSLPLTPSPSHRVPAAADSVRLQGAQGMDGGAGRAGVGRLVLLLLCSWLL